MRNAERTVGVRDGLPQRRYMHVRLFSDELETAMKYSEDGRLP
jgi:hypothetical protein